MVVEGAVEGSRDFGNDGRRDEGDKRGKSRRSDEGSDLKDEGVEEECEKERDDDGEDDCKVRTCFGASIVDRNIHVGSGRPDVPFGEDRNRRGPIVCVGDKRVFHIGDVVVIAGAGKDLGPEIGSLAHISGRGSVDDRDRDAVPAGRTGTQKGDPGGRSKGPRIQAHGRDIEVKNKLETPVDVNGKMVSHVDRGGADNDRASASNGEGYDRNAGTGFKSERRIGTDVDRERGGQTRPVDPKKSC